jgi:hypothetical protein
MLPELDNKEVAWGFTGIGIPAEVFLNNNLTATEKMLFGLIRNIAQTSKGCWASNRWLSGFLDVSADRVSRSISNLQQEGYLLVHLYKKQGSTNETERHIFIDNSYKDKYRALVVQVNESFIPPIPVVENNHPPRQKQLGGMVKTTTNEVIEEVKDSKTLCSEKPSSINRPKRTQPTPVVLPDPDLPFKNIASALHRVCTKNYPNNIIPPKQVNDWIKPIKKIFNIWKGTPDQLLEWLHVYYNNFDKNDKYHPVIRSGLSLFEKIDKLEGFVNKVRRETKEDYKQPVLPYQEEPKRPRFINPHPHDRNETTDFSYLEDSYPHRKK